MVYNTISLQASTPIYIRPSKNCSPIYQHLTGPKVEFHSDCITGAVHYRFAKLSNAEYCKEITEREYYVVSDRPYTASDTE